MTNTGLDVFDTTLQKTNAWLGDVMAELHTDDRKQAYRVLKEVLHALRDRLTVEEAAHLGAQLPMLLRGLWYESWSPERTPTDDDLDAFLARVRDALSDRPGVPDPERHARAVFAVISRRVDHGELLDVTHLLPEGIRSLWPDEVNA
jgi:uncharacterized protein (DUF2267 family)